MKSISLTKPQDDFTITSVNNWSIYVFVMNIQVKCQYSLLPLQGLDQFTTFMSHNNLGR